MTYEPGIHDHSDENLPLDGAGMVGLDIVGILLRGTNVAFIDLTDPATRHDNFEMNEDELPPSVQRCIQALRADGIWYRLTQNEYATSCEDAASKRVRGGEIGIPLEDELQSLVIKRRKPDVFGNEIVALHCRASDRIDFGGKWPQRVLGKKTSQLTAEKLAETFDGATYGAVNPVLLSHVALENNIKLLQVCDTATMPADGTMMTNAGDHQYGLEIQPRNMFWNLPDDQIMVLPIRK